MIIMLSNKVNGWASKCFYSTGQLMDYWKAHKSRLQNIKCNLVAVYSKKDSELSVSELFNAFRALEEMYFASLQTFCINESLYEEVANE